jgi:prevent-host-death family protein
MMTEVGVADAKRRFSELIDRVGRGERFVVSRRGKPAIGLVPPEEVRAGAPESPTGLLAIAGALANWDELDEVVSEIYATRRRSMDRPVPELE